jgi:8-oxo-dGTP diphosphatase
MRENLRIVTAAVLVEEGRLLLARRPPGDRLAGLWELPGGKLEADETPEECLAREMLEEMDMVVVVGDLLARTTHQYSHGSFDMMAYEARRESLYQLHAHDQCVWATRAQASQLALAPADVDLVRQLAPYRKWE